MPEPTDYEAIADRFAAEIASDSGDAGPVSGIDRYLQPCFRFPQRGTFFVS